MLELSWKFKVDKELFTKTKPTDWKSKDLGEFFHKGNNKVERKQNNNNNKILEF